MAITLRAAMAATALLCALHAGANSPYISAVYDYCPAPGQFINVIPTWNTGYTQADMTARAAEQLCGDARPGMVCLGAFGGYVVFGFDHPVVNVTGEYDFKVYGNALISSSDPYGGSSEPGVVWVSADTNGNGLPDDTWYELAGSEHDNAATVHGLKVTYHRPASESDNIRWTSSHPDHPEGYVERNTFHRQSYWPEWTDAATIELEGTLLPGNAVDKSGTGSNWVLAAFAYGYADNLPDDVDPGLNIDNAVDSDGRSVHLPSIDFVKVQSGMLQNCGWLGETSTEVCGAEDLHPDAVDGIADPTTGTAVGTERLRIWTIDGRTVYTGTAADADEATGRLGHGIYVVERGNHRTKIWR